MTSTYRCGKPRVTAHDEQGPSEVQYEEGTAISQDTHRNHPLNCGDPA